MGDNTAERARAALLVWLKVVDEDTGNRTDEWYEPVMEVLACPRMSLYFVSCYRIVRP